MPSPRARLPVVGALFLLVTGCQSNPTIASLFARRQPAPAIENAPTEPLQNESSFVLEGGMVVYWDAQPARIEPGQVRSGTAAIGPDGNLVLGPYGTCKIAGISIDRAQKALEQHLAAYMARPRVHLSMTATPDAGDIAWRPAQAAASAAVISSNASEGHIGESMTDGPQGVETVIWRR